jgi:hypothetical protein
LQHVAVPEEKLRRLMPQIEADYRRQFHALYQ